MDRVLADAIERARQGDTTAFDAVVRAYASPLVRFTARIVGGDVHAAHDVVQETFVATWKALPRLTEPRYLKAWLYQVAYHHAISWVRRRGSGASPLPGLLPRPEEDDLTHDPPEPDRCGRVWKVADAWLTSQEVDSPLQEALTSLPAHYSAPITLFYLEGIPAPDAARALGVPFTTFKMRLHRGRTLLRERLLERLRKEEWSPRAATPQRPHASGPVPAPNPGTAAPPADPSSTDTAARNTA